MLKNTNRLFVFQLGMALLLGCCGTAHAATPAISAGSVYTIALKSDSAVLSWGNDSSGQLGLGRLTQSANPILSSGISGIKAISAGYGHTVALKGKALSGRGDGTIMANSAMARRLAE